MSQGPTGGGGCSRASSRAGTPRGRGRGRGCPSGAAAEGPGAAAAAGEVAPRAGAAARGAAEQNALRRQPPARVLWLFSEAKETARALHTRSVKRAGVFRGSRGSGGGRADSGEGFRYPDIGQKCPRPHPSATRPGRGRLNCHLSKPPTSNFSLGPNRTKTPQGTAGGRTGPPPPPSRWRRRTPPPRRRRPSGSPCGSWAAQRSGYAPPRPPPPPTARERDDLATTTRSLPLDMPRVPPSLQHRAPGPRPAPAAGRPLPPQSAGRNGNGPARPPPDPRPPAGG